MSYAMSYRVNLAKNDKEGTSSGELLAKEIHSFFRIKSRLHFDIATVFENYESQTSEHYTPDIDSSIGRLDYNEGVLQENHINQDEINQNSDTYSVENQINESRSFLLNTNTLDFLKLIKEEDFEFGYISRSEQLLRTNLNKNALATRNWLNEIFIKYFSDHQVIVGILRIISRFEPKEVFPQGQTIALAALSHRNSEIKELGIRAFEQWSSQESLNILREVEVDKPWLKEYLSNVIQDLSEQLCHT